MLQQPLGAGALPKKQRDRRPRGVGDKQRRESPGGADRWSGRTNWVILDRETHFTLPYIAVLLLCNKRTRFCRNTRTEARILDTLTSLCAVLQAASMDK